MKEDDTKMWKDANRCTKMNKKWLKFFKDVAKRSEMLYDSYWKEMRSWKRKKKRSVLAARKN